MDKTYTMFFKTFESEFNATTKSHSFAPYIDRFNFFRYIHNHNTADVGNLAATATADFAASVIQSLYRSDFFDKSLITQGLRCCRDITLSLGYHESSSHDIVPDLLKNGVDLLSDVNILVVVGCQTEELLINRAIATAQLCADLLTKKHNNIITVIFSGKATNQTDAVPIPMEYRRLKKYFIDELKRISHRRRDEINRTVNLQEETLSETTDQNVFRIINKIISEHSGCKINLCLVSSNFHIFRLARETEKAINTSLVGNRLKERSITINSLSFLGSEEDNGSNSVKELSIYIKSMFFELYNYFIDRNLLRI